jgi:hypothetical protein
MGLDLAAEAFDPQEKTAKMKWYREVHDYKGLDLVPFAPFGIERPGGFKHVKRHITLEQPTGDGTRLPLAAGELMYTFRSRPRRMACAF